MNCSRSETLLTDYMERTLDEPVLEAVRKHLESCAACQALYGEVVLLREQLESFPEVTPPADLVDRILVKTSGRPEKRSLWRDLIVPTLRPFMTQRFAFATIILFVFLSLMVNLVGPPAGAVLSPSRLAESADRFTGELSKTWAEIQDYESRAVKEVLLMKEDLFGRLDYHLISMLFKNYSESVKEQDRKQEQKSDPKTTDGAESADKPAATPKN